MAPDDVNHQATPSKTQRWLPYAAGLLAVALYVVGAGVHLELFSASPQRIWGDEGDGFFNLWLMDHTYEHLRHGALAGLPDGRIFAPDAPKTFFWSDNLLIPAIPYSLLRTIGLARFTAYHWTGYLMVALFYLSLLALFYQLNALGRSRWPKWPGWSIVCVPCFAYIACFSPGLLQNFFHHFQNLSSGWLFLAVGAMIAYQRHPRGRYILLVALAETLLIFSTLYFAVMGAVLILLWGIFELFKDPRGILARGLRIAPALAPLALACGWLAFQYHQVPHTERPPSLVKTMAIDGAHLHTPTPGTQTHRLMTALGEEPPRVDHEKPAYLGAGLLLASVLLIACGVPWCVFRWHRSRHAWIIIGLTLVASLCNIRSPLMQTQAVVGTWLLCLWLIMALYSCGRNGYAQAVPATTGLLIVMMLVVYGLANGPRSRFLGLSPNPSLWGVFALGVPGVTKMRAIGRLAVIGQGLLLACIFVITLMIASRGRRWALATAVCLVIALVLQVVDTRALRAYGHDYPSHPVTATPQERAFLESQQGIMLVLPSRPFHKNTHAMLFSTGFLGLELMNGYSSRSTALWDELMEAGRTHGEGSPEQIAMARNQGTDWIMAFKHRMRRHELTMLRDAYPDPEFESDKILVIRL